MTRDFTETPILPVPKNHTTAEYNLSTQQPQKTKKARTHEMTRDLTETPIQKNWKH